MTARAIGVGGAPPESGRRRDLEVDLVHVANVNRSIKSVLQDCVDMVAQALSGRVAPSAVSGRGDFQSAVPPVDPANVFWIVTGGELPSRGCWLRVSVHVWIATDWCSYGRHTVLSARAFCCTWYLCSVFGLVLSHTGWNMTGSPVGVPIRPSWVVDGLRIIDNSAIVDCLLTESCLSHLHESTVVELHVEIAIHQ